MRLLPGHILPTQDSNGYGSRLIERSVSYLLHVSIHYEVCRSFHAGKFWHVVDGGRLYLYTAEKVTISHKAFSQQNW
jgi:hypothetical protein